MKKFILLFAFGCFCSMHSQVNNNNNNPHADPEVRTTPAHVPENGNSYTRGDQTFIFVPNASGYQVNQSEHGTTTTIGKLTQSVQEDGYYIMYSNDRDTPSYGRFDEDGNFKAYKYDPSQDQVIEDNYIKNMTDRNKRNNTNRNIQENMNTDEGIETPSSRSHQINTTP